jgi:SAM-dependent methyltransferase
MLYDAGCEVYGMDISEKAIEYCISAFQNLDDGGGSYFKATDILKENPFENIAFDFIMASGVLLCFSDEDIGKLLQIFWDMLKEDGIFYANMPTFRHLDYCEYKNAKKENGMVEVKKLGTIDENFYMNIREDKKDVENLFQKFKKVAVYQTEEEYADGICEMIHFIGKK